MVLPVENDQTGIDRRVRVVGHPFSPSGMGEHIRSLYRSLAEVGVDAALVDVHGHFSGQDPALCEEFEDKTTRDLGGGINIFCINGDEIEPILKLLKPRNAFAAGSYNIIYPAWELEQYPEEWARQVERFDEAWGESRFVYDCLQNAVGIPVYHLPLATEVRQRALYSRGHFGLGDSPYTFFFAFDFLSYMERKNPLAVIAAFEKLVRERPFADIRLAIKTSNAERKPEIMAKFTKAIAPIRHHVKLVEGHLSSLEMKALLWQMDCFVSLHRSEGYGFGIAEAMCLGKPVITTGWSGNLDFCTPDATLIVPHKLRGLSEGDYPHWHNQRWADADVNAASRIMRKLVDDPTLGRDIGRRARHHMLVNFSYLARGLAYAGRIAEIDTSPPTRRPRARKTATATASL